MTLGMELEGKVDIEMNIEENKMENIAQRVIPR